MEKKYNILLVLNILMVRLIPYDNVLSDSYKHLLNREFYMAILKPLKPRIKLPYLCPFKKKKKKNFLILKKKQFSKYFEYKP
jgi:hypothetical protein